MRTAVICVLLLLAVSEATKTKTSTGTTDFLGFPMNFSNRRSIMSLLTQVEAKLQSGAIIDTVYKLLDDFKAAVIEEQVAHDVLHDKQVVTCAEELEYREQEVNDATGAFKAGQETLDGCNQQSLQTKSDIGVTKKQLQAARNYVGILEDNRRRENDYYNFRTSVFGDIQDAVSEILIALEELASGEADFAQIVKKTNKIVKLAIQVRQVTNLQPVVQMLVQLSSKGPELDEQIINWAKTILNSFLDNIQEQFEAVVEAENEAQALFDEERSRIQSVLDDLTDALQQLNDQFTQLDKCIVTQSGIVNSAKAKLDRNQQLGDDAEALCTVGEQEYVSASAARKGELKLLLAIRERAESRFGSMSAEANVD